MHFQCRVNTLLTKNTTDIQAPSQGSDLIIVNLSTLYLALCNADEDEDRCLFQHNPAGTSVLIHPASSVIGQARGKSYNQTLQNMMPFLIQHPTQR